MTCNAIFCLLLLLHLSSLVLSDARHHYHHACCASFVLCAEIDVRGIFVFFRRVLALIWNVSRGISGNRDQSSHSGREAVIINCVNENKKRVRFHLWVPCFCIWHHNLNTVALAQPLQIVRSYILTWMCAFFLSFVCHNTYFFWHHTISKKIMPLNTCVRAFWQQTASTVTQPKQNLLVAFINRMMESFSVMRKMKASC